MKVSPLHPFDLSPKEGIEVQRRLSEQLIIKPLKKKVALIAGIDAAYDKGGGRMFAGVVVFSFPALIPIEEVWVETEVHFPYIPGLLTFREAGAVLKALSLIKTSPDLFIFDGQGIAHPRRMGIAAHLGLTINRPSIGCAKSRLVGRFSPVGEKRGSSSLLYHRGEVVGAVVRTRHRVRPVFVSPGHLIDLPDAVSLVLACARGYRLPEPTRQAHLLVSRVKREIKGGEGS
jgi:deoxyribonuclease V